MTELEFKLIPVDEIPVSDKKKRIKKVDELEKKFLQTEFPRVYKADYIQRAYEEKGDKKK